MARTVAQMVLRARQHADQVNSNFVGPDEAISYVSAAYKELYDLLVESFEDYFVTSGSLTVSSGNSVALPADFYKLRGLDLYEGGRYHPLTSFNFNERGYMDEDQVTGTYRLWYVPLASDLTADTDSVTVGNGWEDFIEIDAGMRMLIKEESDISALAMLKENVMDRISSMAKNRNVSLPQVITDVYANSNLNCNDVRYCLMGSTLYLAQGRYGVRY